VTPRPRVYLHPHQAAAIDASATAAHHVQQVDLESVYEPWYCRRGRFLLGADVE
jgi:hypothetical protein